MAKKHVHIIGGGMAGLSAAVSLAPQPDTQVFLYEGSRSCGGRARSFYDAKLDRLIDNGNHLILSGNDAVFQYLQKIDATGSLTGPEEPLFPFVDLEDGKRWDLSLSKGRIPWWLLNKESRVPDIHFSELSALFKLLMANSRQTVADCLDNGQFARRLLIPFAISALNTSCEVGSAQLLGSVIRQSLMQGGSACIPHFPRDGLSETFVDPALSLIQVQGGRIHLTSRLTEIHVENGQVDHLIFNDQKVEIEPEDKIILAVSPHVAQQLLPSIIPDIKIPDEFESILNLHYKVDRDLHCRDAVRKSGFIGVIGGISEWIFVKNGVLSVTVSAANRFTGTDPEEMAGLVWEEICQALNPEMTDSLPVEKPLYRILWEKRATFAATVEQNNRRSSCHTPYDNLYLAGDWTTTGLPATLEGAIRSGFTAAQAVSQF